MCYTERVIRLFLDFVVNIRIYFSIFFRNSAAVMIITYIDIRLLHTYMKLQYGVVVFGVALAWKLELEISLSYFVNKKIILSFIGRTHWITSFGKESITHRNCPLDREFTSSIIKKSVTDRTKDSCRYKLIRSNMNTQILNVKL